MDLLAALQAEDYAGAQPLVEQVLAFEPANELMLEYRTVIQRALKRAGDASDASDAFDGDGDDDAASASSASTASSDAEGAAPDARAAPAVTPAELREDMAAFGLQGTREELRANVGYIRRATAAISAPRPVAADALDFLECK